MSAPFSFIQWTDSLSSLGLLIVWLITYVSPIQRPQICQPTWTPEPPSLVFSLSGSQILSYRPLGHLLWQSPTPLEPHLVSVELMTLDTRHYQWAGILCWSHALGHHDMKFIMFSYWKKYPGLLLLLCSGESTGALLCCTFLRHLSLYLHTPQFAYYNVESDHLRLTELSHQTKTRVTCFPIVGPNQEPRSLRQIDGHRMAYKYVLNGKTKALWASQSNLLIDWNWKSLITGAG